jgi:hypothetical protein
MTKPNDLDITRKDFINAALAGVGAALLKAPAPLDAMPRAEQSAERAAQEPDTFTGPGGVGDYASSNGNTKAVMDAAHKIRDGAYAANLRPIDTGETYDLIVVGGGITGLSAAYFFAKGTDSKRSCLVLDNHPILGGEAKQNEFGVKGMRLIGPQGSNDFGVPRASGLHRAKWWRPVMEGSRSDTPSSTAIRARPVQRPRAGGSARRRSVDAVDHSPCLPSSIAMNRSIRSLPDAVRALARYPS